MTSYELISIIIASVSAIIAVLSVLSARKANTLSSSGIETSLRSLIENGRNIVNTISITMAPLLAQKDEKSFSEIQRKELDIYKGLFKSAVESWLNTYEEACAKYIDNKIDKTRFKKQFHSEIRGVVECQELKSFFDPTTSKFKTILKVYEEWENLEK